MYSRSSRPSGDAAHHGHDPRDGDHGSSTAEQQNDPMSNRADSLSLATTETYVPGNRLNGEFSDNLPTLGFSALNNMNNTSSPSRQPQSLQHPEDGIQSDQALFLAEESSSTNLVGTGISPCSDVNLWGASWTSPGPSWLVGYDFDLEALNTSVLSTMEMAQPLPLFQQQTQFQSTSSQVQGPETMARIECQRKHRSKDDVIKRLWFTKTNDTELEGDPVTGSGQNTPALVTERYDVDDTFRTRVSLKLRPSPNHHPLPSANFLVTLNRQP